MLSNVQRGIIVLLLLPSLLLFLQSLSSFLQSRFSFFSLRSIPSDGSLVGDGQQLGTQQLPSRTALKRSEQPLTTHSPLHGWDEGRASDIALDGHPIFRHADARLE